MILQLKLYQVRSDAWEKLFIVIILYLKFNNVQFPDLMSARINVLEYINNLLLNAKPFYLCSL